MHFRIEFRLSIYQTFSFTIRRSKRPGLRRRRYAAAFECGAGGAGVEGGAHGR